MGIKAFFKKAFGDMKESTKAQHEVDKANWEEAKMSPSQRQAKMQAQRDEQIAAAQQRQAEAQAHIDATKK
jgi:hypothetical protein